MNLYQFRKFCNSQFEKNGFQKTKNGYYILGENILCGFKLQKSNYGACCYVNVFFCIGDYRNALTLPGYYDLDIGFRICAMSKKQTIDGKPFITSMIEYEEYTEEELAYFFQQTFEEKILPPIYSGKKYILENLNKLYSLTLNKEEVLRKLRE